MSSTKIRLTLLSLILLSTGFLIRSPASAASQNPQGIVVSPAFQQVSINASESEHPVNFSITNNKPTAQTLSFSAADFSTLNDSGGLFFVGTNPTELQKKYGLAKWLQLPQKTVTIQPKQTTIINANILNLPDLSSGGHYGAIMISLNSAESTKTNNAVSIHPIASSLLFVTKLGGDTHKLSLQDVSMKRKLFGLPNSIDLRFRNTGNTHLTPRGVVTVKNSSGKLISKGIINDNSGVVLPGTYRRFSVPLQLVASGHSFGRYKLEVDFRFDGLSQYRNYQQSFAYYPLYIFEIIVLVVLIVIVLIKKFKLIARVKDWLGN